MKAKEKQTDRLQYQKDKIIEALLPLVVFDGWTMAAARQAAMEAGYAADMAHAVFPGGIGDILDHYADWADRGMLKALEDTNIEPMRVRDRIREAVLTRIETIKPHKEAEKLALTYWAVPTRSFRAKRILWRTADRIWVWAGDTATDYNYYTKRALLSGVIGTTMMAWLNQSAEDDIIIENFLDRRIDNVMQIGRFLGKLKKSS
jgi:ubiquinone biosynthesis protein COQ9